MSPRSVPAAARATLCSSRCDLLRRLLFAGALTAAVAPTVAWGANCRIDESVSDKLKDAQIAFVGRVTAVTRVPGSGGVPFFDYRFKVDHAVKGLSASAVTLRATKLVDIDNQVVTPSNVTIGVLAARRPGGIRVTNSCSLVDPASLMGASDEPKGGAIKVVIGLVILGVVVLFSLRRLKRRNEAAAHDPALRPGSDLDASQRKNGGSDPKV